MRPNPVQSDWAMRPRLHDLLRQRPPVGALAWLGAGGSQAGRHHRTEGGRGMDFAGLREYRPGDDLRSLDWRHTARHGRPYTKLFHAERERPVLFLVDLGPTMHFGTRGVFKCVQAARVAALLAWAAADAGDRVGGTVAGCESLRNVAPRDGEAGVLALIHALTEAKPATGSSRPAGLASSCKRFARALGPASEAVLISDFSDSEVADVSHFAALRRAAQVTLIRIADPLELAPPPPELYQVETPLGRRVLDLRGEAVRADYRKSCETRSMRISALAARLRANLVTLDTAQPPMHALATRTGTR